MTDARDPSDGPELAVTETLEKAEERKAAEERAFVDVTASAPRPRLQSSRNSAHC